MSNSATAAQARYAFDQLSGEGYASEQSVMVEDSRFLREAENDRLHLASADVQANKGDWIRAFGAWGQMTGNDTAKLNDSIGGAFVGVDGSMFDDVRVGGVFSFSHSTFSASARNTTGSTDDYWFGVYGGKPWGKLALRTGAGNTYHDATTSHATSFNGFSDNDQGNDGVGVWAVADCRCSSVLGFPLTYAAAGAR